mgnify:CR=1 FL=1
MMANIYEFKNYTSRYQNIYLYLSQFLGTLLKFLLCRTFSVIIDYSSESLVQRYRQSHHQIWSCRCDQKTWLVWTHTTFSTISKYSAELKDTFSCGPTNMKFAPHKICSISTLKPTDWTDCTVKVMWAELRKSWKLGTRRHNCEYCPIMNNDLVKMTSWDCQEGKRACIPKFSSNSTHTISLQIHPKNSIFTILRLRLLQLWYMESYRNICMDAPAVFNNTYIIVIMAID